MTRTFRKRITETTYRHRIENEDGPGSLTNIASSETEEVHESLSTHKPSVEDYGKGIKVFSQNGWISYNYKLELFNEETQEWDLIGFIPTFEERFEDEEDDCDW